LLGRSGTPLNAGYTKSVFGETEDYQVAFNAAGFVTSSLSAEQPIPTASGQQAAIFTEVSLRAAAQSD
jgi:hypothetical protein